MKKALVVFLCIILFISLFPFVTIAADRDTSLEESLASDLKLLGLFSGVSDTDFDLNREPTRTEALVMLIRVLGKESEALSGSWTHQFTDVAPWADKYVGYAYQNKLTYGVSGTKFGTENANAAMYLTFVLRALGYSDNNGVDFTWDNPFSLSQNIGLLPRYVNITSFLRADVVLVSYAALPANLKGTKQTLAQKLISAGVFTQSLLDSCYDATAISNPETLKKELSASEIYAQCASSVFSIETYDIEGDLYAFGSGFFIHESGIAVTNHHVLENALSAKITLTNGREYNISGVLSFDDKSDFAIIKVNGSDFNALDIGDSSVIVGGETIYTIGNPRGLTNSISDGIVSNPSRTDLGGMIQITAPISSGSSGGALINAYGKVVGVTTASLASGQNLNFAVPINEVIPEEDIAIFESVHEMFTMAEYAEYNEYLTYNNKPKAYDYFVYESEPNDSIADANHIENGSSVFGVVDDGYYDAFLIHCNTVGTVEVTLFSDSAPKYVKDLILSVRPVNATGSEGVLSDYQIFEDGTASRKAIYIIPHAGTYVIYILSNSLYKSENIYIDYDFYYSFTPGMTIGENTTGYSSGNANRQELAYDALKTWIISNYNKTLSGEKACIYTKTSSYNKWTDTGVIYDEPNDNVTLYYHIYDTGANFYSYLGIEKDGQDFFTGFSFYKYAGQSVTFDGNSTIYAPSFGLEEKFYFSECSGDTSGKSIYEELAYFMYLTSIEYANYLFQNFISPDGTYSMEDFGFTGIP